MKMQPAEMTDTGVRPQSTVAAVEPATSLVRIFSPQRQRAPASGRWREANRSLWAADAIHRANNLAQLAKSLSRVDPTRWGLRHGGPIVAEAEALADIYEELGARADPSAVLPCAMLLGRMATTLVALFGEDTTIDVRLCSRDIFVTPERRRALILIASELIINALKYAFPDRQPGDIHVLLEADRDMGELVVEDDGIGIAETRSPGSGSDLVAAMARLLDGQFERTGRSDGGTRCSIIFPLAIGT